MTPEEEWQPIPGHENFYEVSDRGRVRSVDRHVPCRNHTMFKPGKLLYTWSAGQMGYVHVKLCRDGRKTFHKVQHLVLRAFVGPRPEGLECLHRNGIATDNRLANLEWGTHAENVQDRILHGRSVKPYCKRNHERTPENTYINPQGFRQCRQCIRDARGVIHPRKIRNRKAA